MFSLVNDIETGLVIFSCQRHNAYVILSKNCMVTEHLNNAPSSLPSFIQSKDIKWTLCTPFYASSPSKIEKCYSDMLELASKRYQ